MMSDVHNRIFKLLFFWEGGGGGGGGGMGWLMKVQTSEFDNLYL
jgi:hypothetical protein